MGARVRKIVERMVQNLVWAAQATAWREGQDWEPRQPPRRDAPARDHQATIRIGQVSVLRAGRRSIAIACGFASKPAPSPSR